MKNPKQNKESPDNSEKREVEPTLEIVPRRILVEKLETFHQKPDFTIGILLSGDRITCCDEGVVMEEGGNLIGIATIAPKGEMMSGQPTIVALYVDPHYRGRGYGNQILKRTIERCVERGFSNIRMDIMSSNAMKIIDKLPQELKDKIEVYDLGNVMDDM